MQTLSPLIYAHSADNLTITGRGTLDGNGLKWWLWEFETRKVIKENGGKLPSLDKLQQMWVDANKDLEYPITISLRWNVKCSVRLLFSSTNVRISSLKM